VPSIRTQQGQGTFFTSINQRMMMSHFRTAFCHAPNSFTKGLGNIWTLLSHYAFITRGRGRYARTRVCVLCTMIKGQWDLLHVR